MKKVGFFGGMFDPPHLAHIEIVKHILKKGLVDEIIVCPTVVYSNKSQGIQIASAKDRLEMAKLAFSDIPHVKVIDMEIFENGPVFTIDTLRKLKERFPKNQWVLIVGEDNALKMGSWKESDAIKKEFHILVYPRFSPKKYQDVIDMPIYNISSSTIRECINKNLFCKDLIPIKVLDFIIEKSLYCQSYGQDH